MRIMVLLALALALATPVIEPDRGEAWSRSKKQPQQERKKPAENDVPFATIDSGAYSGMKTRAAVTVRDDGEWLSLWRTHTSKQFPATPLPTVDFSSEMVVAVFLGEQSSGGFSVQIDRIKDAGGKLIVIVGGAGTGAGHASPMSLTQPYHIVRLAKSGLPVFFQGM